MSFMSDGSSAPPDPLRAWLEATGPHVDGGDRAEPERRGPRRLLALTAAMTATAAALAAVVAARPPTISGAAVAAPAVTIPAVAASGEETPPGVAPAGAPAAAPTASSAPTTMPLAPDGLAATPGAVPAPAAAAAVLAVRRAAAASTYVDMAVADGAEVREGVTVVTVSAWVLQHDGGGWDQGRPVRFGVAVGGPPARPGALGRPWVLSALPGRAPQPTWLRIDDAPLVAAAAHALARAGYRTVQGVEASRSDDVPGVVRVHASAVAPGYAAAGRQEVWLSGDGQTVLGNDGGAQPPIPGELP